METELLQTIAAEQEIGLEELLSVSGDEQTGQRQVSRIEKLVLSGKCSTQAALQSLRERVRLLSAEDLLPDTESLKRVPFKYADYYCLLPLRFEGEVLYCALANPFDRIHRTEIERVLDTAIEPAWALSSDIREAIKCSYGIGAQLDKESHSTESVQRAVVNDEAPAIALVEEILLDAHKKRATDVHLEPYETHLRIRYRVDGMLYQQKLAGTIRDKYDAVVARIKVLANMNLADRRRPQDGRLRTTVQGQDFDLRISILPTSHGEAVDIRLLSESQISVDLVELGLSEPALTHVERSLSKQNGIILVTGPTGSGKTTTLYNFLRKLNTPERKIITIEDPIEYQVDGITQLQVHSDIDFTFANGLRSMLRHDPDVMMVGEIRDKETAKIAIQVALTGHLVLSTLHTNDALSSVSRLDDMGAERYLLASTVACIIAQRLVRRICPACKQESQIESPDLTFATFEGAGCLNCNRSGYFGRTGVFEVVQMNERLRELIVGRAPLSVLRQEANQQRMQSLYESGLDKVKAGITTYAEVLRVLQSGD